MQELQQLHIYHGQIALEPLGKLGYFLKESLLIWEGAESVLRMPKPTQFTWNRSFWFLTPTWHPDFLLSNSNCCLAENRRNPPLRRSSCPRSLMSSMIFMWHLEHHWLNFTWRWKVSGSHGIFSFPGLISVLVKVFQGALLYLWPRAEPLAPLLHKCVHAAEQGLLQQAQAD